MARSKIDYSRFSQQQIEAAKLLAEPYEDDGTFKRLTYAEIAERVGVTDRTLRNWRQDDAFIQLVNDLADKAMDDFLPRLYRSLKYRIEVDMSDKAIETALKRMGKLKDTSEVTATIKDEREDKAIESEIEALRRALEEESGNETSETN
jgi:transcriptional regulator with XRE-family HTH domain